MDLHSLAEEDVVHDSPKPSEKNPHDTTTQSIIDDFWNAIITNNHELITKMYTDHHIDVNDSYFSHCRMPDCDCTTKVSIKKNLENFPSGMGTHGFNIPYTFETIKLLFDLSILKRDDIDFLARYMGLCNCSEKMIMTCKLITLFDRDKMREYRSSFNDTLIHKAFRMYFSQRDIEHWHKLVRYLIDDIMIDITTCVYDISIPYDQQDHKSTIMNYAISHKDIYMIQFLHDKGLDVNYYDGDWYQNNKTYIMIEANKIGKLLKKGEYTYSRNCDGKKVYKPLNESERQKTLTRLSNLYDTCELLDKLGYKFDVKNTRRPTDQYYVTKHNRNIEECKFGFTFSDFLKKRNIVDFDPRFARFL